MALFHKHRNSAIPRKTAPGTVSMVFLLGTPAVLIQAGAPGVGSPGRPSFPGGFLPGALRAARIAHAPGALRVGVSPGEPARGPCFPDPRDPGSRGSDSSPRARDWRRPFGFRGCAHRKRGPRGLPSHRGRSAPAAPFPCSTAESAVRVLTRGEARFPRRNVAFNAARSWAKWEGHSSARWEPV